MRVAHLTLSISRRNAGMLDCVRRPAQEMRRTGGIEVEIISVIDDQTENDRTSWEPLSLHLFSSRGPTNLAFAPAAAKCLQALPAELAHTFGLWTYLSRVTHAWHRSTRRPYLVTPQGMLDVWALAHSRWRKRVVGWLYEYAHLRDAACLHATCRAELDAFRAFGLRNPVCVIPNGVDLPPSLPRTNSDAPWKNFVGSGRRALLYLGRLHPKKGLPSLLRAWSILQRQDKTAKEWTLVIAGWDQSGHAAELSAMAANLNLDGSVHFCGPLFGEEKASAYRHADAFVLPSLSEGLPLVVLEAWSYKLPVVMTASCNLPEGFAAGAALESGPAPAELASTITKLIGLADGERQRMGEQGHTLVTNHFTWSSAANRMAMVYRWVVGEGDRPEFVVE